MPAGRSLRLEWVPPSLLVGLGFYLIMIVIDADAIRFLGIIRRILAFGRLGGDSLPPKGWVPHCRPLRLMLCSFQAY